MSFTDKEIERFESILNDLSYASEMGGYDKEHKRVIDWLKQHDHRLIEEIEREVIGEDNEKQHRFMDEYEQMFDEAYVAGRNTLRAEQRKKLAEYKHLNQ